MKILLNNREEEFEGDTMTISEMIEIRKFSFKMRIIKINGKFISGENYKNIMIRDGDDVQMLYLMSGG